MVFSTSRVPIHIFLMIVSMAFINVSHADYWGDNRTDNYQDGHFTDDNDNIPLNRYFQTSIHNAYAKGHTIYNILRHYSTNIELDFFDAQNAFPWTQYRSGDWYVRHTLFNPAEDVMCINDGDHDFLSECFEEILRFHNNFPQHDLITLWMDKKQQWQPQSQCQNGTNSPCRRPNDFDALLENMFGSDILFKPRDLLNLSGTNNLRSAVTKKGWPNINRLRGKIMVVITDYDLDNRNLRDYINERGDNARAFIAPKIDRGSIDTPAGLSEHKNSVVFYNLSSSKRHLGPEIFSKNYISRTWGVNLNERSSYDYRAFLIQNGAGDAYTSGARYTGALKHSEIPLFTTLKPRHALNQSFDGVVDGSGKNNGDTVHQWRFAGKGHINQSWFAIPHANVTSNSHSGLFYLSILNSGKRADIKDHNSNNGVNIHLWDHRHAKNQQWILTRNANNDYEIKNNLSRDCMDVLNYNVGSGEEIAQWDCSGNSNQRFHITPWK